MIYGSSELHFKVLFFSEDFPNDICRFHDAGYYFWKLSVQCLDLVSTENSNAEPDYEMLDKFHEYQQKAEIYHLYHSIQRYTVSNDLCFVVSTFDL